MKVLFVAFSFVLLIACQAQDKYEAQNQKLIELTQKGDGSVISMTKKMYNEYISVKRDYSAVIMLSVLSPSRGCDMCISFYNEFKVVASSWNHFHSGPDKVYFFFADYDNAPGVFEAFKIQGAPVVMHVPASSRGKIKSNNMQLRSEDDLVATGLASWLQSEIKLPVKVMYPFPWMTLISSTLICAFIAAIIYSIKDKLTLQMVSIRNIMAIVVLAIVYFFLSGAMWNKIHKAPYSLRGKTGMESYIGRGRSEQLIAESYIIMSFYAFMSLGFIIMSEAPGLIGKKFVKIGLVILGLGLYVGFFQAVLSTAVFKQSYLEHKSVLWFL